MKYEPFLQRISKRLEVSYCNLPGFCGLEDPDSRPYRLEDFADHVKQWHDDNNSPPFYLGFSFGGAVALSHKVLHKSSAKLILVSPAIRRRKTMKSHLAHLAGHAVPLIWRYRMKDWYQSVASRYYRLGTPFLRATYDSIVREDLAPLIERVDVGDVLFIFGDRDEETPWSMVRQDVVRCGHKYCLIAGGGHSLLRSHPDDVTSAIVDFLFTGR